MNAASRITSRFIFPILVFLGGCCYGPSSPTIKMAYDAGFVFREVAMSQYFFGWMFLGVLTVLYLVVHSVLSHRINPQRNPQRIAPKFSGFKLKTVLGFIIAGFSIAMVSLTYAVSLQTLPAYMSVILLFQFTWIGLIIQTVYERRLPGKRSCIAVAVLIFASVLASGVVGNQLGFDPVGMFFGFLSAVFYALYIFLIGRVETSAPPLVKSFLIMTCSLAILTALFGFDYFVSGAVFDGLMYWIVLGSVGCALPMFLFAVATPRISVGAATVLSSSELPASIICAMIILSEAVSGVQWVGIILLLFAIACFRQDKNTGSVG